MRQFAAVVCSWRVIWAHETVGILSHVGRRHAFSSFELVVQYLTVALDIVNLKFTYLLTYLLVNIS